MLEGFSLLGTHIAEDAEVLLGPMGLTATYASKRLRKALAPNGTPQRIADRRMLTVPRLIGSLAFHCVLPGPAARPARIRFSKLLQPACTAR